MNPTPIESKHFNYESIEDEESILKYLDSLKEGFQKKKLIFSKNNSEIELIPGHLVKFEIKAKETDTEVKLNLKFKWKKQLGSKL